MSFIRAKSFSDIDDVLEEGLVPFFACPLMGRWFEIDDHNDLDLANKLFALT